VSRVHRTEVTCGGDYDTAVIVAIVREVPYFSLLSVKVAQLFDEFRVTGARRFGQDLESIAFGGEKPVRQGRIVNLSKMGVDDRLRGLVTGDGLRD
jgi:hypothetical protein